MDTTGEEDVFSKDTEEYESEKGMYTGALMLIY